MSQLAVAMLHRYLVYKSPYCFHGQQMGVPAPRAGVLGHGLPPVDHKELLLHAHCEGSLIYNPASFQQQKKWQRGSAWLAKRVYLKV